MIVDCDPLQRFIGCARMQWHLLNANQSIATVQLCILQIVHCRIVNVWMMQTLLNSMLELSALEYLCLKLLLYTIVQEPGMVETLSKNITRQGLTATTLNYLRVSTTNVPGRLEDLPHEEANEAQPSAGVLPAVSTVVGGGTPGPLPSSGGPQLDGLDFGSESFQFQ